MTSKHFEITHEEYERFKQIEVEHGIMRAALEEINNHWFPFGGIASEALKKVEFGKLCNERFNDHQ